MLQRFLSKLKESALAVTPIAFLILLVGLTPIPLYNFKIDQTIVFLFATVIIIFGIALFNLGADMAMTPMGTEIGRGLTRKKKLGLLLFICFIIGILVTISEPDLTVLADLLSGIMSSPRILIYTVGVGVGGLLVIAVLKIVFKRPLSSLLMFFYFLLFTLALLAAVKGKGGYLPLAFDSGGVTTGPITVPFIMALGIGIAKTLSRKDAKENSFGLIALCSAGAVIAVLLLSIFAFGDISELTFDSSSYDPSKWTNPNDWNLLYRTFINELVTLRLVEVARSLGLIILLFLICQITFLRIPRRQILPIGLGLIFTLAGLALFLAAAGSIYLCVGYSVGSGLATASPVFSIIFALILGALVVIAEPAIAVLVNQVEGVTNGAVTKRSMLIALAIGVGFALAISVARVIYEFDLMYIVVPGYIISLGLSLLVPPIYTSIAFDSGGVASGPLTSCMILPLMIGLCDSLGKNADIYQLAFGVVSLVAMIPLITIQLLGFGAIIRKNRERKVAMKIISSKSDEQIIEF